MDSHSGKGPVHTTTLRDKVPNLTVLEHLQQSCHLPHGSGNGKKMALIMSPTAMPFVMWHLAWQMVLPNLKYENGKCLLLFWIILCNGGCHIPKLNFFSYPILGHEFGNWVIIIVLLGSVCVRISKFHHKHEYFYGSSLGIVT